MTRAAFEMPVELPIGPDRLEADPETPGVLLGCVTIFGVDHHLTLLRVVRKGGRLRAAFAADRGGFRRVARLYEGEQYQTVRVPGHPGAMGGLPPPVRRVTPRRGP
jgi:hypothetical protein